MAGPENRMIKRIATELSKRGVYSEKTHNMYRGGTPDLYIEAPNKAPAWCEAKFVDTPSLELGELYNFESAIATLTPLQEAWLRRSAKNRVRCYLLVGLGPRTYAVAIVYPLEGLMYTGRVMDKERTVDFMINYLYELQN